MKIDKYIYITAIPPAICLAGIAVFHFITRS